VPHPNLAGIITDDVRQAIHLKLTRDDDGRPVDAIHVHGYAPASVTRPIEEAIWAELGASEPLPDCLGMINGQRSESLALTQLLLLYHVIRNRVAQPVTEARSR
jgi:phosphoribulokinase